MQKRKVRKRTWYLLGGLLGLCVLCLGLFYLLDQKEADLLFPDFQNQPLATLEKYSKEHQLKLSTTYETNANVKKDHIIETDIKKGTKLKPNTKINAIVSKGVITKEAYQKVAVNELGKVPIMMYHGIINKKNSETNYTGGNVDKDGYNRTNEAFRADLEFYYQNNYRMIRLNDYLEGKITTEFGKSPLILTFDDGREDNFKVLGKKDGKLEIDPNCAIGILEEFKKKYPDFQVTATFFINQTLFEQKEYNQDILEWLIKNGYDIGNHTLNHPDFTKIDAASSREEVGGMYEILEKYIKGQYVNIVALPFGSPYKKSHPNYEQIVDANYNGKTYHTKAALRVGWEAELSIFDKDFDPSFLKRIRAYDNDGKEFDIAMNFRLLEKNRYISDGDPHTIVIKENQKEQVKEDFQDQVITYE